MTRTNKIYLSMLALVLLASGCGGKSARRSDDPYGPVSQQTPPAQGEQIGPPLPPEAQNAEAEPSGPVGPNPAPDFVPPKDSYVLVLGPGLARGFAYLGVIREMEERQLQIRGIIGVEMGALIAGIYGSSNLNYLEWEMHKFKRNTLLDRPMLGIGSRVAKGEDLYEFLDKTLKVDRLQKMKIPVVVASAVAGDADKKILFDGNGSSKDIIRGAMSIPGVLKPYSYEGLERMSAALETPFPVQQAKDLGLGKVICVDVVGRGDNFSAKDATETQLSALMRSVAALAKQQLKECDVVLNIPTNGISYLNFEAKADLIYKGKVAVKRWLENSK